MRKHAIQFFNYPRRFSTTELSALPKEAREIKQRLDDYYASLSTLDSESENGQATKMPPQVAQGMEQAYAAILAAARQAEATKSAANIRSDAAIKAAKIRGWYGVVTAGVIGTGLFVYKAAINDEKKQIKAQRIEFTKKLREEKEALVNRETLCSQLRETLEKELSSVTKDTAIANALLKKIELSELYIKELCSGNEECLSVYHNSVSLSLEKMNLNESGEKNDFAALKM